MNRTYGCKLFSNLCLYYTFDLASSPVRLAATFPYNDLFGFFRQFLGTGKGASAAIYQSCFALFPKSIFPFVTRLSAYPETPAKFTELLSWLFHEFNKLFS